MNTDSHLDDLMIYLAKPLLKQKPRGEHSNCVAFEGVWVDVTYHFDDEVELVTAEVGGVNVMPWVHAGPLQDLEELVYQEHSEPDAPVWDDEGNLL